MLGFGRINLVGLSKSSLFVEGQYSFNEEGALQVAILASLWH